MRFPSLTCPPNNHSKVSMNNARPTIALIAAGLSALLASNTAGATHPAPPRLILQITVDQLRGDLPDKFSANMGDGGFRYLMDHGVWYANAHYQHANTETVVGHTTLATGADPAVHGMISNVWLDRDSGKLSYNIEDPRYHILTAGGDVDEDTEVDVTQRLASTDGRSPANILVTTFSDELALTSDGKAKVFGVSVKDRGAVTLAGHSGKAFWFSKSAGGFVTSSYYYQQYPDWVDAWNQQSKASNYADQAWSLLYAPSRYIYGEADDQPWEMDFVGFGRSFPHAYGPADGKHYNNYLTFSPAGDELTADFAKTLIDAEDLGRDAITDYLAVSFSSTDYVGHIFGPSSLEAEDNMLRLDRTLADLFAFVDQRVGLENTLIVLSADHGGPEAPGLLEHTGIAAGYVSPNKWDKPSAIAALETRFGVGQELVRSFFPPYVYLNRELIQDKGLDQAEVEQAIADELMKIPGVALVVSSSALAANKLPDTYLNRAALRNYHPARSGDLLIMFEPGFMVNDFHGEITAANHGGPWRYDTFVPIAFAGGKLTGQRVHRPVDPVDIAATLAEVMRTRTPSGSRGIPLPEVMAAQQGTGR